MGVTDVIRAIDRDTDPKSSWMIHGANALNGDYKAGDIVEPRELCIHREAGWLWVRNHGSYVTYWAGEKYVTSRFGRFNSWRIRRAINRWAGLRTLAADEGGAS
jgi:hypothetical protein